MTIIQTSDGSQYQTSGILKKTAAVTAGLMTASAISASQKKLVVPIIRSMQKANIGIDKDELKVAVNNAIEKADNGVKLVDFSGKTSNFTIEKYQKVLQEFNKKSISKDQSFGKFLKDLAELQKKAINKFIIGDMINGNNACFLPKKNKVLINMEKLGTSAFHEIGHSINYSNSKFWRSMQKLRTVAFVIPTVSLLSTLFKRKKMEGEQPKNIVDKSLDFVKNNAGKISVMAFIPVIAEEIRASVRGNKLAKEFTSPNIYKKVFTTNALGAMSYITTAIALGVSVYAAGKVKDSIDQPKLVKQK